MSLSHSILKSLSHHALTLTLAACTIFASAKETTPVQKVLASKNTVSIQNAWVRPTRAGQDVGAAYMTLTSKQDATLVQVESDVTKSIEIHSMVMQKGVMKMRMLETLPLTAGKPYKLEPGGFHLMLFDLTKPLKQGEQVNFELTFKNKDNVEFKQNINVPIQASANGGDKSSDEEHHEHNH
jgi:copper(I)-binding protein